MKLVLHQALGPLFNTKESIEQAKNVASKVIDDVKFDEKELPVSDDFTFYLNKFNGKKIPGFYYFVGAANPEKDIPLQRHHQGKFNIDEEVIPQMSALLAASAIETLKKQSND
ncbi:MAG: hypothetical protein V1712_01565 [Patescibacteria group bacterium]